MPQQEPANISRLTSPLSLPCRRILAGLCLLTVFLLLAAAWSIPFRFESSSMYYKFGIHKILLRSAKVIGLTAAVLAFLQVILVSRLSFLDKIFGLDRLFRGHRWNGIAIALLIPLHGFLNIAAERFVFFPFQSRYWPEFLGLGLAGFFLAFIAGALWRSSFRLPYNLWSRLHHASAILALSLMTVHILYVSESFRSGPPRWLLLSLSGLTVLLFLRIWLRRFVLQKKFTVCATRPAGKDATLLELVPRSGGVFAYLPGQFAFFKPLSGELPHEEHPFTMASAPSRQNALQCIIRACGDWTRSMPRVKVGDAFSVDGPYGLFSYRAAPAGLPLIMIAGGIGITPMLSMLRNLAEDGDSRSLLLIWSNRTPEHIVLPDEITALQQRLIGLRVIHHFTRPSLSDKARGRLDGEHLKKYLSGMDRESVVFLCGPEAMMREIDRDLKDMGYSSATIYKEVFRL